MRRFYIIIGTILVGTITAGAIWLCKNHPVIATSTRVGTGTCGNAASLHSTATGKHTVKTRTGTSVEGGREVTNQQARLLRLNQLYISLDRDGKLAEYAQSLEKNLRRDRYDRDALEELIILFQSPMLNNPEKEFLYLKRFVEYDKTSPSALLRLSQYEAQNNNTKVAFELASEAAQIDTERATAHRLDGAIFLEKAGDIEHSAQLCQQIIQDQNSKGRGLLYAGDKLLQQGQMELALQAYDLAVERANQENIRQRAQIGVYRIRAQIEGVDAVRAELEALATDGVTPLVQQQADSILASQSTTSP